ncbi:MAG: hypothetical protein H6736_18890 [Alphaproteobacteria bacterium]|nr:hypothetical protein [Alphaproteobacteria bacterium]
MSPEELVHTDAGLLDAHDYRRWRALLAPDVRYLVPPRGFPEADPREVLFLIADDAARLESRLAQLARMPRTPTRRTVGPIHAEAGRVVASFRLRVVRPDRSTDLSGTIRYRLDGHGRIAERRVVLDDAVVERMDYLL